MNWALMDDDAALVSESRMSFTDNCLLHGLFHVLLVQIGLGLL